MWQLTMLNVEEVLSLCLSLASRLKGEGKVRVRSHLIKASGSGKAWYVLPRLFAPYGLAVGPSKHPVGYSSATERRTLIPMA